MKGQYRSVSLTLLGLGLAVLPARGLRAAGFSYKEVARLGVATPGGNKLVNDFEPGTVSGAGDVAFVADDDVAGNGGSNSEGLFLATNGTIKAILEPGTPVGPGAPDWAFKSGDNGIIQMLLSPVGMNVEGDISFGSDVQKKGDADVKSGNFLWIKKTGQFVVLNLPGQAAPGGGQFDVTKGGTWTSVNDQDDTTFTAQVADAQGNVDEGVFVWTAADGKLHDIARPGDKVADSFFTKARRSMINNAGEVVFEGTVDKTGNVGIYLSKDGKITAIATPDTTVPGGTEKFSAVAEPRLNNKGDVIFLGDTSAGWGAYRLGANDTNLTPLVQAGSALKDGTKLDQVHEKYGTTALSDSGDTAMVLNLGGGGAAVYLIRSSDAAAVAKDGDNLAGIGVIEFVLGNNVGDYLGINSADQVAFSAMFKDGHMGLILATPVP